MEDERKVFSFGVEELAEAEELNARANTRMTEEYKEFLRQQYGNEEDFPEHLTDRANGFPECGPDDTDAFPEFEPEDILCEDNGGEENVISDADCGAEDLTDTNDRPEEQSDADDFYLDDEPGFD